MTAQRAILAHIQALADAIGGDLQVALGTPGAYAINSAGERRPTGQAWAPAPRTLELLFAGLARATAQGRALPASGPLLPGDSWIDLTGNDVIVTLPAPSADLIGCYGIKARGTTGGAVSGTIDGSPTTIPCAGWACVRLRCDGAAWVTD